MTTDANNIQTQVASPVEEKKVELPVGGENAQPVVTPTPEPVKPSYLTKEDMMGVLKEVMPSYLEPLKDRVAQSAKDRTLSELSRKAKTADALSQKVRQRILTDHPEYENDLKLAEYEARDEATYQTQQEEVARQQQIEHAGKIQAQLLNTLSDAGIDPQSKEVDWARDATDYATGLGRFNKSLVKILKDRESKKETELNSKLEERIKASEAKIRKDLGIETVDVGGAVGGVSDGIPTDMATFRKWVNDLPQKEYEKKADKIKTMLNEGKIK